MEVDYAILLLTLLKIMASILHIIYSKLLIRYVVRKIYQSTSYKLCQRIS